MLLAKFFKVHPGYLVDDPEGYQTELISDVGALEDKLDLWLINGAERFRHDPDLAQALLTVARHADSRMCLVLLGAILENPGLAERLLQVLEARPRRKEAFAMTWADIYLICFLVGFVLSAMAFLAGACTCASAAPAFSRTLPRAAATGMRWRPRRRSAFRISTSAPWPAFLAWFGGTGYLLARYSALWFLLALGIRFTERPGRRGHRVSGSGEGADAAREFLDPADYDMIGVLGTVTQPDPAGRHRRDDLFAGRRAPRRRRPQRDGRGDREGH